MLITVCMLIILFFMLGIASDLVRAFLIKEQVQTAVDAASLTGASSAKMYKKVYVYHYGPGKQYTCCFENSKGGTSCYTCCDCLYEEDYCSTEILGINEYANHGCPTCENEVGVQRTFVRYNLGSAYSIFDKNIEKISLGDNESISPSIFERNATVYQYGPDDYYNEPSDTPSVIATANINLETNFLKVIGKPTLNISCTSQSSSYYQLINNRQYQGRTKIPAEYDNATRTDRR